MTFSCHPVLLLMLVANSADHLVKHLIVLSTQLGALCSPPAQESLYECITDFLCLPELSFGEQQAGSSASQCPFSSVSLSEILESMPS